MIFYRCTKQVLATVNLHIGVVFVVYAWSVGHHRLAICFLVLEVPHKVGRKSTKVENVEHANVVTIGTVERNVGLSPCHRFDTVASNKPMLATVFGHRINFRGVLQ